MRWPLANQGVWLNARVKPSSGARLTQLISGFMPTQLIHVMARLGIADLLAEQGMAEQGMTVAELSSAAGAQPERLKRLLRGLAGIGLIELTADDRVALTELGGLLVSTHPGSLHSVALHAGGEAYRAWAELEQGVRTCETPFEAAHGASFFDHLRDHPSAGAAFDGMMTQLSRSVVHEVVSSCDFASASRVLDVGGGRGHLVAAVLDANPHLLGAVLDVPEACAEAEGFVASKGLADRCRVIAGSFFEAIPPGYDVHLLKWILHDWSDTSCQTILETCRSSMPERGQLLIVEQLLPDKVVAGAVFHPAVAMDLTMLVNFAEGRERTLTEYGRLLSRSGFAIRQTIELPSSGFSVLDCTPRPT